MKVSATQNNVNASTEKIYQLIANPRNFSRSLPEQITIEEVTDDYCKFNIPGVTSLTLRIAEKNPFSNITYAAENDKNITTSIAISLQAIQDNLSSLTVEIDVAIPIFLAGMVKNPLQNLVTLIAERIKVKAETE